MWPILISAGPIVIYSFGVMLFLGVFLGGFWWWRKGKEDGLEEESLIDTWLIMGIAGVIGARLGHIIMNWNYFGASWYKMIFLTKYPGLNYEFAWLAALGALILLVRQQGWKLWPVLEMSVGSWLVVEIFGRLGAFLAGSGLGVVTSGWWGIGGRWPVQAIWAVSLWLLFQLLKKWEKEYRMFEWYKQVSGEAEPGFICGVYLLGLGLLNFSLNFIVEVHSQWFGPLLIVSGGLILLVRSGKLKQLVKTKPVLKTVSLKSKLLRKKRGFDFK